jgi:hypothetical protein
MGITLRIRNQNFFVTEKHICGFSVSFIPNSILKIYGSLLEDFQVDIKAQTLHPAVFRIQLIFDNCFQFGME